MHDMSAQVRRNTRPPRYRIPNSEPAIVCIGTDRLSVVLDALSITGGRIRSAKRFNRSTFADIELTTVSGKFTAAIELMGSARGNTQAFRFIQIGPADRRRLEDALKKLQTQGLNEKQPTSSLGNLVRSARALFTSGDKK